MYIVVSLLFILSIFLTNSETIFSNNQRLQKGDFGSFEFVQETDELKEKIVYLSESNVATSHTHRQDFYKEISTIKQNHQEQMTNKTLYTCRDRKPEYEGKGYWYWAPVFLGNFVHQNQTVEYDGICFKKIIVTLHYLPDENNYNEIELEIKTTGRHDDKCKETMLIATSQKYHIDYFSAEKTYTIRFKNFDKNDLLEMKTDGIRIYSFCESVKDSIVAFIKTLTLFLGGLGSNPKIPIFGTHVPEYMERANVAFLKQELGWELKKRTVNRIDIDESTIKSGDFVAIYRLDGIDEIIMWGSGSAVGHSATALWIEGELYVIESQDGWYWPQHGIQRTKFSQWVNWARDADFNVAILPLKDEVRARFNETAAYEWFKTVEGLPYGYHNFLFGWIDTAEDNWPPMLPPKFIPIGFSIFEKILPSVTKTFLLEALNKRLGTKDLMMHDLIGEAVKRNTTISDVFGMVEKEEWVYSDGVSYVCSAFVTGVYKRAGVFGDLEIESQEFTPRDVYQLNIFNDTAVLPKQCKDADPNLPYCQILGKYQIHLPGYSTIKPYPHMNERCPSIAPEFIRPDGC